MATEIITVTWCDPCLADDGTRTEGTDFPITIEDEGPRILALCEPHRKEFWEPLALLVAELSQPVPRDGRVSAPARTSRQKECAVCGKVLTDTTGQRKHIARIHQMTMGEYMREHPEAGEKRSLAGPPEITCPVSGCEQVYSHELGNNRPRQAISLHLRKRHGSNLEEHGL